MATAERITLRGAERRQLTRIVRAHTSEQRYVLRARIVLGAALGRNNCEIADEMGCDRETVRKWRGRFAAMRMDGLDSSIRPPAPVFKHPEAPSDLATAWRVSARGIDFPFSMLR